MKKRDLLILFGALLFANGANADLLMTESGFYYPVNKKHSGHYLRFGQRNSHYGNKCHLANDYDVAEGTHVYSISSGIVERVSKNVSNYGGDTPSKSGGAIVIKHRKSDGTIFYALYGHIKNFKVKKGEYVKAGAYIGDVGSYYSGKKYLPHLHFGINSSVPSYAGYTPTKECKNFLGYVNPENFMEKNSPLVDSVIDGAGSLVSPSEYCSGCNNDIAIMHKHSIGSTVVFQVLKDSYYCSYIDIVSDKDLGRVLIKKKGWNSDYAQDAFSVDMKANEKISIYPVIGDEWSVISLTTQKPLDVDNATVSLTCQKPHYGFINGDRKYIANDLPAVYSKDLFQTTVNKKMDFKRFNFFTGSGSVISKVNARVSFGVSKDYLYTQKVKKKSTLTTLQWYSDDGCKKLHIEAANNSSYQIGEVSMKQWSNKSWKSKCKMLPCDIEVSNSDYYVLKFVTKPSQVSGGYLQASCR